MTNLPISLTTIGQSITLESLYKRERQVEQLFIYTHVISMWHTQTFSRVR